MGATFSRSRTFIAGETLTAVNLNAVETNILNNFTPAGMDDQSTDVTAMRVTVDPYPSSVASLSTALQGEIERLRYILVQITGETYWYIDPDVSLATLYSTQLTAATAQSGSLNYIADTGTADVYVATLVPAVTAYTTGMEVNVKIVNANLTTTPTLNVNALGAKTIKRGNSAALLASDLPANHQAMFRYNGTDMILLNPALLSIPTIADFTNANHTHANAAGGGGTLAPTTLTLAGSVWPSFSVHNSIDQNMTGTYAKVTWATELFDTNNNFDITTNERFTPTVAGKYLLSATAQFFDTANLTSVSLAIYKNGSLYLAVTEAFDTTELTKSKSITCVVDANGTTDYFEIYGKATGSNPKINGGATTTMFSGCRIG